MDKEHILDEIRRTTKEKGGVSIGRIRFFTETGIKESHWRGIHWARWNDAILEAGLTPNAKNTAYDEAWLLLKLVTFTRELGRIPTMPELRLKSRTDKEFPNDRTFATRFGDKDQRIAKIAEYCRTHAGFEDVLATCAGAVRVNAGRDEEDDNRGQMGFVYLFKSGRYYKIGHSNSSGRRAYEVALEMPEKLTEIHKIRTDDPKGIENYWHRRFAASRKNGEWFDLSASDVKKFKLRKFM